MKLKQQPVTSKETDCVPFMIKVSIISDEVMLECEVLVTRALSSPLVRALVQGLESEGCQFDLVRHVVCEPCEGGLAGG